LAGLAGVWLGAALKIEIGLAFLRMVIQPPASTLGSLLNDGYGAMLVDPRAVLFPLAVICGNVILLTRLSNEWVYARSPEAERGMTHPAGIHALFHPRAVAVVGASPNPAKFGKHVLRNLSTSGFAGTVWAINPQYQSVDAVPCYPSVSAAPGTVDLAVVIVDADRVAAVVRDCMASAVPNVLIMSSGFGELGPVGRQLQERLAGLVRGSGTRLIGPNSLGVMSGPAALNATFIPPMRRSTVGADASLAMVSCSGALGNALAQQLADRGLQCRYWIDIGNEIDLSHADIVEWLTGHDEIRVIGAYLEGWRNLPRLLAAGRAWKASGRRIVLLGPSGESAQVKTAISAHTGQIMRSPGVVAALCRASGIAYTSSWAEFVDIVDIASRWTVGVQGPSRIAVVTTSGGAGVLMADAVQQRGFRLAALEDATKDRLRAELPRFAAVDNPIDITASVVLNPGLLKRTIEILAEDRSLDTILIYLPGYMVEDRARPLVDAVAGTPANGKNVAVVTAPTIEGLGTLSAVRERMPSFDDNEGCPKALNVLWPPARLPSTGTEVETRLASLAPALGFAETWDLLAGLGVPVAPSLVLDRTPGVAALDEAARTLGEPVVMKVVGTGPGSKQARGLLRKALAGAARIRAAYDELVRAKAEDDCVVMQPQLDGLVEWFAAVLADDNLGRIVIAGLGGSLASVVRDLVVLPSPVDADAAALIIQRTHIGAFVAEHYGEPRVHQFVEILRALDRALDGGTCALELNPVVMRASDYAVVDARAWRG